MRWITLLLVALFLAACGEAATPVPPPLPTATAPVPVAGLGASAGAWEQQHGTPSHGGVATGEGGYEPTGGAPKYFVRFWNVGVHPVTAIERQVLNGRPLSPDLLRQEAHRLLPPDAHLVKPVTDTRIIGWDSTDELFTSPSLRDRYPPDAATGPYSWGGEDPGTILISYADDGMGWHMEAGAGEQKQLTRRQVLTVEAGLALPTRTPNTAPPSVAGTLAALKAAGLPIGVIWIPTLADSSTGEGASWHDTRLPAPLDPAKPTLNDGGVLMITRPLNLMQAPPNTFVHGLVELEVSPALTPAQAAEYQAALDTLP